MYTTQTTNTTLNIIDSAFGLIETVSEFDYIAFGNRIITIIATVAAIIIGTASYVSTAAQLFWEEHGEVIMTRTFQVIIFTLDFAGNCYYTGRNFRIIANSAVAQLADSAYYILQEV
jgi:hypothetical protein